MRRDPKQSVTESASLTRMSAQPSNSLFQKILAISHCESRFCEEGHRYPSPNSSRIKILKNLRKKNPSRVPHFSRVPCARIGDFKPTFVSVFEHGISSNCDLPVIYPVVSAHLIGWEDSIRTANSLFHKILPVTSCESRFCGEDHRYPLPNSKRIKILQIRAKKNFARQYPLQARPMNRSIPSELPNALFIISLPLNE